MASLPPDVNIHALLEYRQGQVRRREYRPLGLLEKVMLEASGVADTSGANPLTGNRRQSANIDYYRKGPLVGLSADQQDLLIVGPMVHPPDLPDPNWRQPYPPTNFVNGIPVPAVPPRVPQRLRDRAAGVLPANGAVPYWNPFGKFLGWFKPRNENDFWFVFCPVHQILLLLADRTGMAMVQCGADGRGRHTTLLYNPHRLQGHIVFGSNALEFYRA